MGDVPVDFSDSERERLLTLMDGLHGGYPHRSPIQQIWMPFVRELAVNGEPDMAMKDLADWIGEVKPSIGDLDREFLAELATRFSAEDADESVRQWSDV